MMCLDFKILIILCLIKYDINVSGFKNAEYLNNLWDVRISFVLVLLIGYNWMKNALKMINLII